MVVLRADSVGGSTMIIIAGSTIAAMKTTRGKVIAFGSKVSRFKSFGFVGSVGVGIGARRAPRRAASSTARARARPNRAVVRAGGRSGGAHAREREEKERERKEAKESNKSGVVAVGHGQGGKGEEVVRLCGVVVVGLCVVRRGRTGRSGFRGRGGRSGFRGRGGIR